MKRVTALSMMAALAASVCVLSSAAMAADSGPATPQVVGEKLDSGLGDLPHYRHWADPTGKRLQPTNAGAATALAAAQVAGEKLDSGLGNLPHYRDWADASGKQAMPKRTTAEREGVQLSQAN
jgi:hypothetical protein